MSERHDIDKLAREGTNQAPPFSYKEEHWDKAAGLLDQGSATGMRKWIGLGLLFLIGIGGAGLTYLLIRADDSQAEGKSAQQQVLASNALDINLSNATKQVTFVPTPKSKTNPAGESQWSEAVEEQLQATADQESSHAEAGNNSIASRNPEPASDRKGRVGSSKNSSAGTELIVAANQETIEKEQSESERNRDSGSEPMQAVTEEGGSSPRDSKAVEESEGQVPAKLVGQNAGIKGSTPAGASAPPKPAFSWFTLDLLHDNRIAQNEVQLPPIHSEYDPDEVIRKKYRGAKWEFWIQGGARITATWDSSSSLSLDPVIGVGVSYDLSPRIQVSSGISAFMRSGESLPKNYTVRHYSFGVEYKHYGQVLNRVYYARLPLSIQYRFHPRHQVGVGGHLNYVVTTYSSASDNWPAEVAVDAEEFEGYHYLDGLKRMNGGLDLHYNYLLNDLWSVWLKLEYGLGSGLTPEYYDTGKLGRNHGLSVGIRHYLK